MMNEKQLKLLNEVFDTEVTEKEIYRLKECLGVDGIDTTWCYLYDELLKDRYLGLKFDPIDFTLIKLKIIGAILMVFGNDKALSIYPIDRDWETNI